MSTITFAQVNESASKKFLDWVGDNYPVELEAEPLVEPKTTWFRFAIRTLSGKQLSLGQPGNRVYERKATAVIQIFTPADAGTKEAKTLAQTIKDIFEGTTFDGLFFLDSTIREIGTDGQWYQVVVENNFIYNELK